MGRRSRGRIRVGGVITTDAAGAATAVYGPVYGAVEAVSVKEGTWTNGAADLTFTDTTTGVLLLTVTNIDGNKRFPVRDLITDTAGADIAAAATSTNPYTPHIVNGTITVVVAGGGDTLAGEVYIDVNEDTKV